MTRLRRTLPALRADGRQNIFHVNDEGNVIAWQRWTSRGEDVVIVASFNNEDFPEYCLGMPGGGLKRARSLCHLQIHRTLFVVILITIRGTTCLWKKEAFELQKSNSFVC